MHYLHYTLTLYIPIKMAITSRHMPGVRPEKLAGNITAGSHRTKKL